MAAGGAPSRVRHRLPLVINARVDTFFAPYLAGAGAGTQMGLVAEALTRAEAYVEAGADCVYAITLWELDAVERFTSRVCAPVNIACLPEGPQRAELAEIGVARVSWAISL